MNKTRKTPAGLNCPIILSEEFPTVEDDNVCAAPIADKETLEFVQNSKRIMGADSDDGNEMNNAAPVPTSSEMRNIMKMFNVTDLWPKCHESSSLVPLKTRLTEGSDRH
ncbi:hypothetical protein TNCV_1728631 [Trichonephila clavipes]|nr:hypothetical protein TNCV_1728631 [Trichonephila clavipes]